jgi:hypothetical protein
VAAVLNRSEQLALWLGPRVLLALLLLIPSAVQYGDIAEVLQRRHVCAGAGQALISFIASQYPVSIFLIVAAGFIALCLLRLNAIVVVGALLFIAAFNILPQFYAACS